MHSRQLLIKSLLRYPVLVVLTVLLEFSGALFNGFSTVLIVPILLELLGQSTELTGQLPGILQRFLGIFDGVAEGYRLPAMAIAVVGMIILKNAATYGGSLVSNSLNRKLAAHLRLEGLRILLGVDLSYYAKTRVGDLINHLNIEVSRTTIAVRALARMATAIITISVFVGLLLWTSWQLTVIAIVALGAVALVNQTAVRQAKVYGAELSQLSRSYSARIVEILSGIRLVKATANEDTEYAGISQLIADREISEYRSQLLFAGIAPVNEVCSIIALISVAAVGRMVMAERIEAFSSILLTYLLVLFRMLPSIGQLNSARSQLANVGPSVVVVSEFLRRDDKPFMNPGHKPYAQLQQGIHFKQLFFRYPGSEKPVLSGVDLYLKKGTTLALVGASGAGKSTLADLLPRFYDPTEGQIEIDGIDLKALDTKSFRRSLGIVSQDTFLFNASVRDNLIYGRPEATEDEIKDAMYRANAHEFILSLPEGLETLIGDRGVLLSGGQRQRLAIARALLQDPDILILDEATSALDTISERLVQKAIDELSKDRTTLVIAHRLSTVQNADQIAVMDQGQVVETGTHTELLNKGGYYSQLCAIQFSEKIKDEMYGQEFSEWEDTVNRASYEMRSRLSSILGILGLLTDGITIQDRRERDEMTASAYETTLRLLKVIEDLEKSGREVLN
ncbi:ABC transporter ATP-binding protein [Leptolyngbya sp. BC1307]|uniref:ABC transporter ATP-binding protein n=1 Tax=Leptolyngbya sp. BC1307 TaxID=2029589 RepID=UPI000EFB9A27|nr:ABC transporter ATP-binding protein [Leptolyngbya sp. BC1307]